MSFSPAAHTPSPSHTLPRTSFPSYTGIETPPPPPPKPGSHDQSRLGTPLSGPPLPAHHGLATGSGSGSPVPDGMIGNLPSMENTDAGLGISGSDAHGQSQNIQSQQVQPPAIEEGWLPDAVKDKSYVFFFFFWTSHYIQQVSCDLWMLT